MAQMLCYNYLKLWCILYAVLACIGDCKARPGMLFSCAKSRPVARTITKMLMMMLMMIVMAVAAAKTALMMMMVMLDVMLTVATAMTTSGRLVAIRSANKVETALIICS